MTLPLRTSSFFLLALSACAASPVVPRPGVEPSPRFDALRWLPADPDLVAHVQFDHLRHSETGPTLLAWLDQGLVRAVRAEGDGGAVDPAGDSGADPGADVAAELHAELAAIDELWVTERVEPGGADELVLVVRTREGAEPSAFVAALDEVAPRTRVGRISESAASAEPRGLDLASRGLASLESADFGVFVDLDRMRRRGDASLDAGGNGLDAASAVRLEVRTGFGVAAELTLRGEPSRMAGAGSRLASRLEALRHEPLLHFLQLDEALEAATISSDATSVTLWSALSAGEALETVQRADGALRDVLAHGPGIWRQRVIADPHPVSATATDRRFCMFATGILTRLETAARNGADLSACRDQIRELRRMRTLACL